MKQTLLNYAQALGLVVALGVLAAVLARISALKAPILCTEQARMIEFLLASAFLLVAGIGRLGWSGQTWGGVTPAERMDQGIFLALSLIGTFLFVFENLAGHLARH